MKKKPFGSIVIGEKFKYKRKKYTKLSLFTAGDNDPDCIPDVFSFTTKVKINDPGFFDKLKSLFFRVCYYFNMKFV